MSQELAEGVWVRTQVGIAATKAGPFNSFDLYGDAVETKLHSRPLHEATEAIAEAVQNPATCNDGVIRNIRGYLRGLNRITDGESQRGKPIEYFRPSSPALDAMRRALAIAGGRPDETIDFLDNTLSLEGFGIFVAYIMTNCKLWPEDCEAKGEDPRVSMLEALKVVA